MTEVLRPSPRGLLLHVKATPKAGKTIIAGIKDGELLVKITAPPDKGKANAAIIDLLSSEMCVAKSTFELVQGETARHKVFRIPVHDEKVTAWIMDLLQKRE